MSLSGTGYSTNDLYFAAFLKTAGCKMARHEKQGNRIIFVFEEAPMIDDLMNEWYSREAKVDALTYADNIRNLKSLCHMVLKNEKERRKK